MGKRVVAIGLDSTDYEFLNRYISCGELANFRELRRQSALTRLENQANYLDGSSPFSGTEGNWVMFQTGVRPVRSGFWETVTYCPDTYRTTNDFTHGGYDYDEYRPFYDLGDKARVAILDIPVSVVVPELNGRQIVGWGGHFPYVVRGSTPGGLLKETNRRFGKNRVLYRDHGVFWSRRYRKWLENAAIQATTQREKILHDFLDDESLDLVIGVFGETHSVLHDLWAQADKSHPAHIDDGQPDPLLNVFRRIDQAIGSIRERLGPEDNLILFSVHGMQPNSTDLPCLFLLSELMYRFNFPGRYGFARGIPGEPVPPPVRSGLHWYWFGEIWRKKYCAWPWLFPVLRRLPSWSRWAMPGGHFRFPFFTALKGATNGWMPATWYRPGWRKSRSFAIPAFADGHIRINLKGREKHGVVTVREYDDECQRIMRFLKRLVNPRNGQPVVRKVLRTRRDPLDRDERLLAADLVVVWTDEPFDVVEGPGADRVGPVPYFRTGGHRAGGFAMLNGPGFLPNTTIETADVIDLAPTILGLMGLAVPDHFEGRSIAQRQSCPVSAVA